MLITEIARQARVSPATVSRAINQPQIVAPDSLARIRAVMKEHNYVPAPVNRRRGPKRHAAGQRRIGVWFVGAKAGNPSLNWFQDQLLQVQPEEGRVRVDVRLLFSQTPDALPNSLAEEKLDAKAATKKAMGQITGALVGVTTVLTAVFIPMAFFSGSTGAIYRQFSVTIVSAMVLSGLLEIGRAHV